VSVRDGFSVTSIDFSRTTPYVVQVRVRVRMLVGWLTVALFGLFVAVPASGDAVNGVDLSVQLTITPVLVEAGKNVTTTATVTNLGTSTATGVTMFDGLDPRYSPQPATILNATATQGSCVEPAVIGPTTGEMTCDLGSLAAGASATVTVVEQAQFITVPIAVIYNTATVTSNEQPFAPGFNGQESGSFVFASGADLKTDSVPDADPVAVGADLTYLAGYFNVGPDAASNVTFTDTLPASVAVISVTPDRGSCTVGVAVTCTVASLAPRNGVGVQIVVRPTSTGTIVNTTSVTSDTFDVDASNNTSSVTSSVKQPYVFNGFLGSITNPPAVNAANAGSVISVKWQSNDLTIDGLGVISYVSYEQVSCSDWQTIIVPRVQANWPGRGDLSFEAGTDRFTFRWNTPPITGCYRLVVRYIDASTHTALFRLT
jgi:uncharacterized repeat protein (TIGR01451 family)